MKKFVAALFIVFLSSAIAQNAELFDMRIQALSFHEQTIGKDIATLDEANFLDRVSKILDVCELKLTPQEIPQNYASWYQQRVAVLKSNRMRIVQTADTLRGRGDRAGAIFADSLERRVNSLQAELQPPAQVPTTASSAVIPSTRPIVSSSVSKSRPNSGVGVGVGVGRGESAGVGRGSSNGSVRRVD